MRFICFVKMDEAIPPGPAAVYAAMAAYEREGRLNGTLVELGGLQPSSEGAIVSLADGRIKAVDGPFAESKELVGGYAVIDVHSREEAIELGRRLMQIHVDNWPGWDGSVELRRLSGY